MHKAILMIRLALAVASDTNSSSSALISLFPCCISLGSSIQLLWRNSSQTLTFDFVLQHNLSVDTYVAWGPATPGTINRLMAGADVIAAGYNDDPSNAVPKPWCADMFLSG